MRKLLLLLLLLLLLPLSKNCLAETIPAVATWSCYTFYGYRGDVSFSECVKLNIEALKLFMDKEAKPGYSVHYIGDTLLGPYVHFLTFNRSGFGSYYGEYFSEDESFNYHVSSFSCPVGYVKSNSDGKINASDDYCTRPSCTAPFFHEGSECVTYCPPGESFDFTLGQCVGNLSVKPELAQCDAVPQERGNPVIVSSGEKVQREQPDLDSGGPFPLSFQRTYRSQAAQEAQAQYTATYTSWLFTKISIPVKETWTRYVQPADYTGPSLSISLWLQPVNKWTQLTEAKVVPVAGQKQWRNNYNYALLTHVDGSVDVVMPDDRLQRFIKQADGSYLASNPSSVALTRVTDTAGKVSWTFRDADNSQYRFADNGQFIQLINPNGLSQRLTYNTKGLLATVSDDFGHQFTLSYSDDDRFLTSIVSNSGAQVSYTYDEVGNLKLVTRKPVSALSTTRQYHYEDPNFPYALTGITDERNIRFATWKYDPQGRAIESSHAGGAEKTTFVYAPNATTVTNALNKSDIYNYAQVAGARRLVSVAGQASTSCLAANQNYSYYDNGLLKSKTDWQGNTTSYEYNSRGLVTKQTEAEGKPEARVTTTEWHPTLALPTKVTQGKVVITYTYDAQGRLKNRQIGK